MSGSSLTELKLFSVSKQTRSVTHELKGGGAGSHRIQNTLFVQGHASSSRRSRITRRRWSPSPSPDHTFSTSGYCRIPVRHAFRPRRNRLPRRWTRKAARLLLLDSLLSHFSPAGATDVLSRSPHRKIRIRLQLSSVNPHSYGVTPQSQLQSLFSSPQGQDGDFIPDELRAPFTFSDATRLVFSLHSHTSLKHAHVKQYGRTFS